MLHQVDGFIFQGGFVGGGEMPERKNHVVQAEGDQRVGQKPGSLFEGELADHGIHQPAGDASQQEGRRHQGQQGMLNHVGGEKVMVANGVKG